MTVREIFKNNMRFYRKKSGLTQEQLAEIIGCNSKYVSEIESRNKFPSAEIIDKIAEALEIRPVELFDDRGSPRNVQSTFSYIYGKSLQDELSKRIIKDIEDVCKMF